MLSDDCFYSQDNYWTIDKSNINLPKISDRFPMTVSILKITIGQ
ncbi:hypothetical protein [Okeania sp. SIO3B5]|nr:hypothetical protein [Okeania sp. SIO3B5]